MNSKFPILTLMVALNCEAKPWVDFYGLRKISDRPFALYRKDGVNVEIVITGIGAHAMSTAVGWVGGRSASAKRVWLNLGIAGHLDRNIGEAIRAHSFIDSIDLRRYYLPLTATWPGEVEALMSVNAPTDSYPDAAMIDMEGVAFYKAASMFVSAELIASIKIISDNKTSNVEELNASKISQLMQEHVTAINIFSDNLLALIEPINLEPIHLHCEGFRMTHSQRQQLNRLLEKASVLELHQSVSELVFSKTRDSNDMLSQLRSLIDITAPTIDRGLQAKGPMSTYTKGVPNG